MTEQKPIKEEENKENKPKNLPQKPILPVKNNMKPKFPTNFKSSPNTNTIRRRQGKRGG
jgi:hypothetical protein